LVGHERDEVRPNAGSAAGNYAFDLAESVSYTMSDRPATMSEVDEDEIEVTPLMIEAGYRVLATSGLADVLLEADRLVVAEIFEAMLLVQKQQNPPS
jgi:hypothetical protein